MKPNNLERFLKRAILVAKIVKLYCILLVIASTATVTHAVLQMHQPITTEDIVMIGRNLPSWIGRQLVVYGSDVAPAYALAICLCIIGWVGCFAVQVTIERELRESESEE